MEDTFYIGAKALIFNQSNQLLLLNKKNRNPIWDLPGGRVQKNESIKDALKREVFEETGIQSLEMIKFIGLYPSSVRIQTESDSVGLIFALHLCSLKNDTPITLSQEHDAFAWKTISESIKCLKNGFPTMMVEQITKVHAF